MNELSGNTYYGIYFRRDINGFMNLDIGNVDKLDCENIKDKIILLGYLGPTDEDKFKTSSGDEMYGTVIMANIMVDLLTSDSFIKN